jgi:hypothetical protein
MKNSALPALEPLEHCQVRPEAMPFWEAIIVARARDEWTDVDLVVASQLSECQYQIEEQKKQLEDESDVLTNAKGTRVCNPRLTIIERLVARQIMLMRTLTINARASGDPRDKKPRRALEKKSREISKELKDEEEDDENLLAS